MQAQLPIIIDIKKYFANHLTPLAIEFTVISSSAMSLLSNHQKLPDEGFEAGSSHHEQIHGEVDKITYFNESNGWTVLKARDIDAQSIFTVTGCLPPIREGEHFQFVGTWSKHSTYGRQFKVERAVPVRPASRASILRYLSSGLITGIGPKTAERIVEHFGLETFKILDENPGCLLQVPKIGKKKAAEIIESWKAQKSTADVMMFLSNHGISLTFAQKILRMYGDTAIEVISGNPYQLAIDIGGVGFIKADAIAKSIGIAPDSPERIRAAIMYQIQQSEERGHCYQTSQQLIDSLISSLGLPHDKLQIICHDQLQVLANSGSLLVDRVVLNSCDQPSYWQPELLGAELQVADGLARLMARSVDADQSRITQWLLKYNEATPHPLSESQANAVRQAISSKVFILTGGPGVGKTTTANAIIRLFKAMGKSVLLAAPTGRAAQRLSEISAEKARTIHRLLEWQPAELAFARNEHNPLVADVIICDESSMLDIKLAAAVIAAAPEHAQLVFIGDVDQLPSVGPGNFLRDLIASSLVPCVVLKEIFRQASASQIIRFAHEINHGRLPYFESESPRDCLFIEADTNESIHQTVQKLLTETLSEKYHFNPVKDVQILSPMNRGDLGTSALNEELQALLNPKVAIKSESQPNQTRDRKLFPGDKVIQTSNNYDLNVFNGDIGYVLATNVEGGNTKIEFGDGRIVNYDRDQINDLKLAYAITIHKSQGSEFPVVIIPSTMQHYVMLQRNLIYTGLTRAKKLAIFIGSKKALAFAVRNNESGSRQTNLTHRLTKALSGRF